MNYAVGFSKLAELLLNISTYPAEQKNYLRVLDSERPLVPYLCTSRNFLTMKCHFFHL